MSVLTTKRNRRLLLAELAAAAVTALSGIRPGPATAQGGEVTPDGRTYTAYVPAATKTGQFYQYSCEFDASWVVLATFGKDVSFEEQLDVVGHDISVEPYFEETAEGFVIYGGDITSAFCGDYTSNMLARSTGTAFLPLFEHYGLGAETVKTREEIEAALDRSGLVWTKATVDFQPWADTTWLHRVVSRCQPCLATTTRSWSWATTMMAWSSGTFWAQPIPIGSGRTNTMSPGRPSSPSSKPRVQTVSPSSPRMTSQPPRSVRSNRLARSNRRIP